MLIRSHCTAPGGFQTELEEGKESSIKKTDFKGQGSGELTTEDEVMRQVLSIHSDGGWLYIQQQLNAPPCPLLNRSLLGDSVFLLQFVSSCLLLFSDTSTLLLVCSVQKAEQLLG